MVTQLVYSLCSLNIPRDAYQQAEIGIKVNIQNLLLMGNLVFLLVIKK